MNINMQTHSNTFDDEEKALISSFENDDWNSIKNLKKEKSVARKIAAKTLRKDT